MSDRVVLSTEELVKFDNIQPKYNADKDIHIKYTLGSFVHASPRDWVGLFPCQWQSTLNPLTFQWASPKPKYMRKKPCLKRSLTFSITSLRKAIAKGSQSYQFAYVTQSGDVIGISSTCVLEMVHDEGQREAGAGGTKPPGEENSNTPVTVGIEESEDDNEVSFLFPGQGSRVCSESLEIVSSPSSSNSDGDWESIHSPERELQDDIITLSTTSSEIEILSISPSKCNTLAWETTDSRTMVLEGESLPNQQCGQQMVCASTALKPVLLTSQELPIERNVEAVVQDILEAASSTNTNSGSDEVKITEFCSGQVEAIAKTSNVARQRGFSIQPKTYPRKKTCTKRKKNLGVNSCSGSTASQSFKTSTFIGKLCETELIQQSKRDRNLNQHLVSKALHVTTKERKRLIEKNKKSNDFPTGVLNKLLINALIPKMNEDKNHNFEKNSTAKMTFPPQQNIDRNCFLKSQIIVEDKGEVDSSIVSEVKIVSKNLKDPSLSNLSSTENNFPQDGLRDGYWPLSQLRDVNVSNDKTPHTQVFIRQEDTDKLHPTGPNEGPSQNNERCQNEQVQTSPKTTDQNGSQNTKESEEEARKGKSVDSDNRVVTGVIISTSFQQRVDVEKDVATFDQKRQLTKNNLDSSVPETETSKMRDDKEISRIRQNYINKASTLIKGKLKKNLKAKARRDRKTLDGLALAQFIADQLDIGTDVKSKRENAKKSAAMLKTMDSEGSTDDTCKNELSLERQSTVKEDSLSDASSVLAQDFKASPPPLVLPKQKTLNSVIKLGDALASPIRNPRPHVPAYLLDVMDALPTTVQNTDGNSFHDLQRAWLPLNLTKTLSPLKARDLLKSHVKDRSEHTQKSGPTPWTDRKETGTLDDRERITVLGCPNKCFANIVQTGRCKEEKGKDIEVDKDFDGTTDDTGDHSKNTSSAMDHSSKRNVWEDDDESTQKPDGTVSGLFAEMAIETQVSLLRKLDQKQRLQWKGNRARGGSSGKLNRCRQARSKRLRKKFVLARRSKYSVDTAYPELVLDSECRQKPQTPKDNVVLSVTLEKGTANLRKPWIFSAAPTTDVTTDWSGSVLAHNLAMPPKPRAETTDPFLRIHGRSLVLARRPDSCENDTIVENTETLQAVAAEGRRREADPLMLMAPNVDLMRNMELRRETKTTSNRRLRCRKKRTSAMARCQEMRHPWTAATPMMLLRAMAQIESLKFKLRSNARKTMTLQREANALRDRLKIKDALGTEPESAACTEINEVGTRHPGEDVESGLKHGPRQTDKESLVRSRKKRRLDEDRAPTDAFNLPNSLQNVPTFSFARPTTEKPCSNTHGVPPFRDFPHVPQTQQQRARDSQDTPWTFSRPDPVSVTIDPHTTDKETASLNYSTDLKREAISVVLQPETPSLKPEVTRTTSDDRKERSAQHPYFQTASHLHPPDRFSAFPQVRDPSIHFHQGGQSATFYAPQFAPMSTNPQNLPPPLGDFPRNAWQRPEQNLSCFGPTARMPPSSSVQVKPSSHELPSRPKVFPNYSSMLKRAQKRKKAKQALAKKTFSGNLFGPPDSHFCPISDNPGFCRVNPSSETEIFGNKNNFCFNTEKYENIQMEVLPNGRDYVKNVNDYVPIGTCACTHQQRRYPSSYPEYLHEIPAEWVGYTKDDFQQPSPLACNSGGFCSQPHPSNNRANSYSSPCHTFSEHSRQDGVMDDHWPRQEQFQANQRMHSRDTNGAHFSRRPSHAHFIKKHDNHTKNLHVFPQNKDCFFRSESSPASSGTQIPVDTYFLARLVNTL